MRRIGTLESEEYAHLFQDYLLTLGIKGSIDQNADGWHVWVHDEDEVAAAKEEFLRFVESPDDEQIRNLAAVADRLRKAERKKSEALRKKTIDVRHRWERPIYARCPVTFALIVISVLVTLGTQLGQQHEPILNKLVINSYRIQGDSIVWHRGLADVKSGQIWRLVTPIFLHFGLMHIVFNVLMTYSLGAPVESQRGALRMLLLVLAIAIPSNIGQYYVSGPSFGGLSGVVYGLFGYIWMKSKFEPSGSLYMPPNTVFWLLGWFLLCFTGLVGHVANTVHAIGLAVGVIWGYASAQLSNKR